MDIESYRSYCIQKKEVTESFPFRNLPNVLVFKVAGKMFSATDITSFTSLSVRCESATIDELRARYPALQKPSYFSERHWSRIVLNNTIADKLILEWIDISYALAITKLTKKIRTELNLVLKDQRIIKDTNSKIINK